MRFRCNSFRPLVAIAAAPAARAQQDFRQTVARVAFVQGEGSFQRGDDPESWQPLAVNVPMTIGDRVWTGASGRLELQAPGFRAFVSPRTELTALNLTEDVQQYSVAQGTASFRVISMDDEDEFEIDTPNAAISLERPGLYRVYVDTAGNTRFAVRLGEARVSAAGGEVALRTGEEMIVTGIDDPEYDVVAIPFADSWDRWVSSREQRRHEVVAYDYTSHDVLGAEDLDAYGDWESVPQYGRVWRPRSVAAGWAPYRIGHWIWQDPWGWTWVSAEPWGWAPYHYGRWVVVSRRWCWVPVAPNVRHVAYAPALVAFVGGGPGWSLTVSVGGGGGGYVGWFPLAPRDPFRPWWGRQPSSPAYSRNVVYTNRAYATVVERSAFVGSRPAQTAVVRDTAIVRQLQNAAVVQGPLPVLPTRESLRPASAVAPRPPDAVLTRPVAARLAPPPAPPAFTRKVEAIREGRGAPVNPQAANAIVAKSPGGSRPAVAIRPVVLPDRKVQLAPRKDAEGAPPPDPIRARSRDLVMPEAKPPAKPRRERPRAPRSRNRPPRRGPSRRRRRRLRSRRSRARRARAAAPNRAGPPALQPRAAARRRAWTGPDRARGTCRRAARAQGRAEAGGEARGEAGADRRSGSRERSPEERPEAAEGRTEAGQGEEGEEGLAGDGEGRAPRQEQLAQERAVAAALVGAVAADGEIRPVREGGEKVEDGSRVGPAHLGAVAPRERLPARRVVLRGLARLQELFAGREVRQPDVVEVALARSPPSGRRAAVSAPCRSAGPRRGCAGSRDGRSGPAWRRRRAQPFLRAAAVQIAPARSTVPKSARAGGANPRRTNAPKQTKTKARIDDRGPIERDESGTRGLTVVEAEGDRQDAHDADPHLGRRRDAEGREHGVRRHDEGGAEDDEVDPEDADARRRGAHRIDSMTLSSASRLGLRTSSGRSTSDLPVEPRTSEKDGFFGSR